LPSDFDRLQIKPELLQGVKLPRDFFWVRLPSSRRFSRGSPKFGTHGFSPGANPPSIVLVQMRSRALLCASVALTALGCVFGCHTREPLELLVVHRLDPSRASSGDRVAITGEGFPEGRAATVTFRGDLLRPGLPKQSDVRIVAPAVPSERGTVAIAFDRAMERRFAGSGESAAHTTFVGDVQVTFQPGPDGSMPLSGAAHAVRFDVLPSAGEALEPEDPDESPSLAFLGLSATPDPAGRGLLVGALDPDGRAFAAGIRRGDLLVEVDGITVLSASDLRVRGGQRTARVVVERAGRPLPPLSVDVEGLSPLGVADVAGAASFVLLGCLLVALPATRVGVLLRWLGRLVEPGRLAESRRSGLSGIFLALMPPEGTGRALLAAAIAPFVIVLAAFVWLSLGHSLIAPDSDLLAIALGTAGALIVARAAEGAARARASRARALVSSAGRALVLALPAVFAVLGAVVASGRFVVAEMVAEQGGAPWRWAGMRDPGLFVLSVLLVASAVPEAAAPNSAPAVEGVPEAPSRKATTARTVVRFAESAYLWTACGLAVVMFLGGWRVPGVPSAAQEASRALTAVGAVLFLLKLWTIALLLGALRRRAGRISVDHVSSLALRVALPATVLALCVATGWTAAQDGLRSAIGSDFLGYVAVMLTAALGAYVVAAALRGRTSAATVASVNPWL
jgi:NADH-quinone oxidoreductase subunit H